MELLVVMALMSVLALLLTAAVRRTRDAGDGAQCINNLRVITEANIRYAAENGGQFCLAMDKANRRRWHGERADLDETFDPTRGPLAPYLGREGRVKICPSFKDMLKGGDSFEVGAGGYGYNAAYVGGSPANKWEGELLSNIPRAAVMFADTALAKPKGIQEYPFAEPFQWVTSSGRLGGALTPSVHFRHGGKANVAWTDGRITSEKPSRIGEYNFYGGDNKKHAIGWFGPSSSNGYWNPRRQTVE